MKGPPVYGIPPIVWLLASRSRRYRRRPRAQACAIVQQRSNGKDFEAACADILRSAGWVVREIGGSGDQGADLLASCLGSTIVVQCKDHTFPVSNKAVQEAYAAAAHHGAKRAIVVSPGGYTQSALELGRSTRVLLLDLSDLPRLHVMLGLIERLVQPKLTRHEFRPGSLSVVVAEPRRRKLLERWFVRNSAARL